MFDYLIVGAGFAGSVLAERIATKLGKKVLIVDKRAHIGGNAFDYFDENGILVHKYGPHIFHTNSILVVNYLSKFTNWNVYFHRVHAIVEGKKVPIPFNLNSLYQLFPLQLAEKIEHQLISRYGFGKKVTILELKNEKSEYLKILADYIYINIFYGYTLKQWGLKPEELDHSVISRVPIFIGRDDRYFYDSYQVMPKNGYHILFQNMLMNKNIHLLLNTDFKEVSNILKYKKIIFTGPIDEFFDYIYGELPYRSLKFEFQNLNSEYFQECGQMNYPNNNLFTRITEFKYLTMQKHNSTTIAYEFPEKFIRDKNIPYYPVPRNINTDLYNKYKNESKKYKSVYFFGRLADYKYYNMDQIIARVLIAFKKGIIK